MEILPTGALGFQATPARAQRRAATGFHLPAEVEGPGQAGPVTGLSMDWALSLQEVEPAAERDRRARGHGARLLELLARLQAGLLAGEDGVRPDELALLEAALPVAADPGLQQVIAAIALRAHVELARRQVGAA